MGLNPRSSVQHSPQRVGIQDANAAVGHLDVAGGLERTQHPSRRRARNIGDGAEVFLTDVDLDRRLPRAGAQPATAEAQQHRDAPPEMFADHEIVRGADGDIVVGDGREKEIPPAPGPP